MDTNYKMDLSKMEIFMEHPMEICVEQPVVQSSEEDLTEKKRKHLAELRRKQNERYRDKHPVEYREYHRQLYHKKKENNPEYVERVRENNRRSAKNNRIKNGLPTYSRSGRPATKGIVKPLETYIEEFNNTNIGIMC
jgi:DNA replication protein DnaC